MRGKIISNCQKRLITLFFNGGFILVSDYVRMEVTLVGSSWDFFQIKVIQWNDTSEIIIYALLGYLPTQFSFRFPRATLFPG